MSYYAYTSNGSRSGDADGQHPDLSAAGRQQWHCSHCGYAPNSGTLCRGCYRPKEQEQTIGSERPYPSTMTSHSHRGLPAVRGAGAEAQSSNVARCASCRKCATTLRALSACGCQVCAACIEEPLAALSRKHYRIERLSSPFCCPACCKQIMISDLRAVLGHGRFEQIEGFVYDILESYVVTNGARHDVVLPEADVRNGLYMCRALLKIENSIKEQRLTLAESGMTELARALSRTRQSSSPSGGLADLFAAAVIYCGGFHRSIRVWLARVGGVLDQEAELEGVDEEVLPLLEELSQSPALLPVLTLNVATDLIPPYRGSLYGALHRHLGQERSVQADLRALKRRASHTLEIGDVGVQLARFCRAVLRTYEVVKAAVDAERAKHTALAGQAPPPVSAAAGASAEPTAAPAKAVSSGDAAAKQSPPPGTVQMAPSHQPADSCRRSAKRPSSWRAQNQQAGMEHPHHRHPSAPSFGVSSEAPAPSDRPLALTSLPPASELTMISPHMPADTATPSSLATRLGRQDSGQEDPELQLALQMSMTSFEEEVTHRSSNASPNAKGPSHASGRAPLVGPRQPMSMLARSLGDLGDRVTAIAPYYPEWRQVIGDGNCFYRAFLFSFLEGLIGHPENAAAVHKRTGTLLERLETDPKLVSLACSKSLAGWLGGGYMLLDLLGAIADGQLLLPALESDMREKDMSDPVIEFLRLLTSWEMQQDPERYVHAIAGIYTQLDGDTSADGSEAGQALRQVVGYCESTVAVMGEEADQCELIALSRCLRVPIELESIGNNMESYHYNTFQRDPDGSPEKAKMASSPSCLLYRPGHYDIIYTSRILQGDY